MVELHFKRCKLLEIYDSHPDSTFCEDLNWTMKLEPENIRLRTSDKRIQQPQLGMQLRKKGKKP